MPYKDPAQKKEQMKRWSASNADRRKAYGQQYYKDHKEKLKDLAFQRMYGLTLQQADEMLKAQNGLCACCGEEPAVHLDHIHGTTKARGILCAGCNVGIGHFRESPDRLRKAIEYLQRTTT